MNDDIINAKKLLNKNRRGQYTIPSNNLYPHQWSWDSAWIIYGYCITKEYEKAENEMYALFNYQWVNGLVPSIVFHNLENNTYFPGPDVWELN